MPDNLGAPLDYSGLPPDVLAGLQLVNLGPGRPSQPAIQQHPAAQQAAGAATGRPTPGGGQVADLATALRQLVQVASTPQHPDQQTALRQLVALMQHPALGQGTQVAGDVVPFQGKPSDSYIYTPGNQLYQPGQSTNPGGKPMQMPWWMMYYPWPSANQALLGKPTAGGPFG